MPKIEARALDPKTAAEVQRCGVNIAVLLAAFFSTVINDMLKAHNEARHLRSCQQQGFTAAVFVGFLLAAQQHIDTDVSQPLARAKDRAAN